MSSPKKPKSKSYRCKRYGILNRHGDVWTPNSFEDEAGAHQHLETYWRTFPGGPHSTRGFKIVPVRVTVTPLRAAPAE